MKKVIIFVKRKRGMSKKAFREYYEAKHAFLGPQFFEGILTEFRRYYPDALRHLPGHWENIPDQMQSAEEVDFGFDAIGIYTLRDGNGLDEFLRIMSDPQIARVIFEDEANFMDRGGCLSGLCDAVEGGGMISEEGYARRGIAPPSR
jgi:EthD domain